MSLWHLRNLTEFSSPFPSVFCSDFYRICVFYSHLKPTVAYLDLNLPTTADGSLSQSVSPAHSPVHPFLGVICAHRSASHSLSAQLMNLSWAVRFPPAWLQLSRPTAERSDGEQLRGAPRSSLSAGAIVAQRQSDAVISARRLPAGAASSLALTRVAVLPHKRPLPVNDKQRRAATRQLASVGRRGSEALTVKRHQLSGSSSRKKHVGAQQR